MALLSLAVSALLTLWLARPSWLSPLETAAPTPVVQVANRVMPAEAGIPVSVLVMTFLVSFLALFGMLAAVPFARQAYHNRIQHRTVLKLVNDLLNSRGRQVVLMMPVYSSGHINAALYLCGMLNQFGRDAVVLDIDLSNRMLSRKIPQTHQYGFYEHLLSPSMKKPYVDPMSGAKVIPLETALSADRVVEFSQIVQRLPRIWERWPSSVVLLDISKWHEGYHHLLPDVSQVVFYVPPDHPTNLLLPRIFKRRYGVSVSIIEIQPDL